MLTVTPVTAGWSRHNSWSVDMMTSRSLIASALVLPLSSISGPHGACLDNTAWG